MAAARTNAADAANRRWRWEAGVVRESVFIVLFSPSLHIRSVRYPTRVLFPGLGLRLVLVAEQALGPAADFRAHRGAYSRAQDGSADRRARHGACGRIEQWRVERSPD